MELQLGLALPNQTPMLVKGLDLNCAYNGGPEMENNKNSGFMDHEVQSKPSSLLLWSGQPNEEDDEAPEKWSENYQINEEESQEIVGWPPINSLRKELLHRCQGGWIPNHRAAAGRVTAARMSMYVKVKMEGVPIGRKIDLRLYNSYQALTDALINMFAKYTKNDSRDGDYTILYQDRDGDWMLAGDVPWETFVQSVQRMEIIKNGN
ncbi:hypothetical protein CDL12_03274 [Handroanthus impetiginosus]|uniref:Auxin-responsive protein n=1 Tax=Handroanthus impetiginosus TaxID=429701 RepID=A0A2G9I2I2_9LAMI|nr:hypothetical protein CDL12_03274 [Handroanthus impetiginosus]